MRLLSSEQTSLSLASCVWCAHVQGTAGGRDRGARAPAPCELAPPPRAPPGEAHPGLSCDSRHPAIACLAHPRTSSRCSPSPKPLRHHPLLAQAPHAPGALPRKAFGVGQSRAAQQRRRCTARGLRLAGSATAAAPRPSATDRRTPHPRCRRPPGLTQRRVSSPRWRPSGACERPHAKKRARAAAGSRPAACIARQPDMTLLPPDVRAAGRGA